MALPLLLGRIGVMVEAGVYGSKSYRVNVADWLPQRGNVRRPRKGKGKGSVTEGELAALKQAVRFDHS